MYQSNKKQSESKNFDPKLTLAIVGIGKMSQLKQIQDFFETMTDFQVVYTKISPKHLFIKEEE